MEGNKMLSIKNSPLFRNWATANFTEHFMPMTMILYMGVQQLQQSISD